MLLLTAAAAIVLGLIALVWSSDKFVAGAAAIAERHGISKLMVGLTIVAFGTSAPEILVSAFASYSGVPALAVGNALGSNIANIGLVLGVTAVFVAIPVHPLSMKQDIPLYLVVVAIVAYTLFDGDLDVSDGIILLITLAVIVALLIKFRSKVEDPQIIENIIADEEDVVEGELSRFKAKANIDFVVGLVVLLISSRMLVWGAVEIAQALGVNEVIIGLTIVAIGTSLPELAATLTSALKKHHDLAIGNIVGSNILNLVAVLPLAGLIAPGDLVEGVFGRDFAVMLLLSVLMAAFIYLPYKKALLSRGKGLVLLFVYIAYLSYLVVISV